MLNYTTEGIDQIPLEHWQAWCINHLAGNPIPVLIHCHGKDIFIELSLNLLWCSFVPFQHVLYLVSREKRLTRNSHVPSSGSSRKPPALEAFQNSAVSWPLWPRQPPTTASLKISSPFPKKWDWESTFSSSFTKYMYKDIVFNMF